MRYGVRRCTTQPKELSVQVVAAGAVATLVPDTIIVWVLTLFLIVAAIISGTVGYWLVGKRKHARDST